MYIVILPVIYVVLPLFALWLIDTVNEKTI